jgi:hypothetical protein
LLQSEVSTVRVWAGVLDSLIITSLPTIFVDFGCKSAVLLWRGSRDGFRPKDFHDRCNGHTSTLTVIDDSNGNIFDGFTGVGWESRE